MQRNKDSPNNPEIPRGPNDGNPEDKGNFVTRMAPGDILEVGPIDILIVRVSKSEVKLCVKAPLSIPIKRNYP
jgi:hypothetical protein